MWLFYSFLPSFRKTSHSECTIRHSDTQPPYQNPAQAQFWCFGVKHHGKTFYRAVSLAGAAKRSSRHNLNRRLKPSLFSDFSLFSFFSVLQIRKCCFRGGSFGHSCDAPKMKPRGRAAALWHTAECNLKNIFAAVWNSAFKVWHPTAAAIDYFLNWFIYQLLSLILFNLFTKPLPRHHFQSFALAFRI